MTRTKDNQNQPLATERDTFVVVVQDFERLEAMFSVIPSDKPKVTINPRIDSILKVWKNSMSLLKWTQIDKIECLRELTEFRRKWRNGRTSNESNSTSNRKRRRERNHSLVDAPGRPGPSFSLLGVLPAAEAGEHPADVPFHAQQASRLRPRAALIRHVWGLCLTKPEGARYFRRAQLWRKQIITTKNNSANFTTVRRRGVCCVTWSLTKSSSSARWP